MTSLHLYQALLGKVNRNDINKNIKVPKSKFVLVFNEQQRKYVDEIQDNQNNSKAIFKIKELYIPDVKLEKIDKLEDKDIFKLPEDFAEYDTSYSVATKGTCKRTLYNICPKPKNIVVLKRDADNQPSFEYENTLAILTGDNLEVYKSDFNLDSVYLNYYKTPKEIDLEGYTRIDGTPSETIDPELSDIDLDKIVDRCAVEITRNYEDVNGFQLAQTRTKE